jgi:hypothetical protein
MQDVKLYKYSKAISSIIIAIKYPSISHKNRFKIDKLDIDQPNIYRKLQ